MAKARKKKRLFIISIIVAALIAACAAVYFGFRTDKITYVGNSHYSNEEMTSRIFGNDTPNTVLYTLFGNKKKTIPFIQKYDVEIQCNWRTSC